MNSNKREYYYFHNSYDQNDIDDIRDVGFENEKFKNWHTKKWSVNVSDPMYLDKVWNQVTERRKIRSIKYITLSFCRPNFRKLIWEKICTKDLKMCIFHFYIKKNGIAYYVCSWTLNKRLSGINHEKVKKNLQGLFSGNLPWYLHSSKNYKDYGYKNTTVNNDPILFFNKVTDIKPKQDVIYTENGTVNVKKVKFEGWNKFTSFRQTQGYCPFRELWSPSLQKRK